MIIIFFFRALSGSPLSCPTHGALFIRADWRGKTFFSFLKIKSQFVAALEFRHKYRHSLDRHPTLYSREKKTVLKRLDTFQIILELEDKMDQLDEIHDTLIGEYRVGQGDI